MLGLPQVQDHACGTGFSGKVVQISGKNDCGTKREERKDWKCVIEKSVFTHIGTEYSQLVRCHCLKKRSNIFSSTICIFILDLKHFSLFFLLPHFSSNLEPFSPMRRRCGFKRKLCVFVSTDVHKSALTVWVCCCECVCLWMWAASERLPLCLPRTRFPSTPNPVSGLVNLQLPSTITPPRWAWPLQMDSRCTTITHTQAHTHKLSETQGRSVVKRSSVLSLSLFSLVQLKRSQFNRGADKKEEPQTKTHMGSILQLWSFCVPGLFMSS